VDKNVVEAIAEPLLRMNKADLTASAVELLKMAASRAFIRKVKECIV